VHGTSLAVDFIKVWGNAQDRVKGRRGGRKEPNGCGGCRESPRRGKPPRWKAVCLERGLYGLGRSGWKRTKLLILPGRNILNRQVGTGNGTSLAAYFIELTKAVIERCLETELDTHLGYPKHGRKGSAHGNTRNGSGPKTLKGEQGHVVCNSLRYVSYKHMKGVAIDLKAIYSASTEAEAQFSLELKALEMGWALSEQKPRPGGRDFPRVIPLFAFPEDIRRIIYTTNATPSVNMTLRHP